MKKRALTPLAILLLVFLSLGMVMFRVMNQDVVGEVPEEGFRAWLWEKRGLDLIIQVTLVFAGALGISAILPGSENDDSS
jgi:hypothetical protein